MIGPVILLSVIARAESVSRPALVTVYWYGMTVPAVMIAGRLPAVRSTCLASCRFDSGLIDWTRALRMRWTSLEPPVEADRPNL